MLAEFNGISEDEMIEATERLLTISSLKGRFQSRQRMMEMVKSFQKIRARWMQLFFKIQLIRRRLSEARLLKNTADMSPISRKLLVKTVLTNGNAIPS